MLVLSPERLVPLGSNDITLFKDGYYFYLDRPTYDSCIILSSKFTNETIAQEIDSETNKEAIEFFEGFLPYPIGILAPFLALIETEVELDIEECVSAIHIITNTISIQRFIGVPKEIRKTVSFSLSIGDEAELSTNSFLSSSIDYERISSLLKGQQAVQYVQEVPQVQQQQVQAPTFQPQQSYTPAPQQEQQPEPASEGFDYASFDLDEAGVEELRAHPDYVETGPGVFYNLVDDSCAIVDVPEDEEFLERSAELDAVEKKARSGDTDEEVGSTPTGSTVSLEEAEGLGSILL